MPTLRERPSMKAYKSKAWDSRYMSSIWSDTDRSWEESHEDWRIVGTNPFHRLLENERTGVDPSQYLYIVEFPSKRLDIASMSSQKLCKNSHVILEADRGEDCGCVKGYTSRESYKAFLDRHRLPEECFKIKRIYRIATDKDLQILSERRDMVKDALEQCRTHVDSKDLRMEILDCEYQFDLNKITFFYRSDERIDFRDLVKDLYKVFKTRIWMCSVDKSIDQLLGELVCE